MSNNKYKVLIVEDEANICSFIETLLTTNDYQALVAHTCTMGLTLFASHNPDLVILDLGLPDRDGLELIRTVRQKYMTPIIVLSARTDEMDKIEALDLGANDYITKPFGTGELLARVRVALRLNRYSRTGDAASGGEFQAQGLRINYDRRKVFVEGQEVRLTQTEYNIVAFLSQHAGRVMTYAAIVRAIWGDTDVGSTNHLHDPSRLIHIPDDQCTALSTEIYINPIQFTDTDASASDGMCLNLHLRHTFCFHNNLSSIRMCTLNVLVLHYKIHPHVFCNFVTVRYAHIIRHHPQ